uniref:Uncharacterized protein n=1 Tax=Electrophorus electricus TaxID=8005 RepID=A0AAY5F248_ELEEL
MERPGKGPHITDTGLEKGPTSQTQVWRGLEKGPTSQTQVWRGLEKGPHITDTYGEAWKRAPHHILCPLMHFCFH